MPLLLLFIVMPVIEMWVLIRVGQQIGAMATIGFVLLTAAVGFALLKRQGFATLFRAQERLNSGELPAMEMAEGIILAVSGALLLTPGFVTDAIGFAGLTPVIRQYWVKQLVARMVAGGTTSYTRYQQPQTRRPAENAGQSTGAGTADKQRPTTLEGEFWREDENNHGSRNRPE